MLGRLFAKLGAGRIPRPGAASGLRAGDLVSVVADDGKFAVAKILVADPGGVHARLYVQRFDRRPAPGDVSELSTAPFGPGHDNPFSIGHMPLSHSTFAGWEPVLVARGAAVSEEELEGYRIWVDAEAGYF